MGRTLEFPNVTQDLVMDLGWGYACERPDSSCTVLIENKI